MSVVMLATAGASQASHRSRTNKMHGNMLLPVNYGEGVGAGATDGETLLQPLILLTCDTSAVQNELCCTPQSLDLTCSTNAVLMNCVAPRG
jgi:hypothetical protein